MEFDNELDNLSNKLMDLVLITKCELGNDVIEKFRTLNRINNYQELKELYIDQISQLEEYKNKIFNN